TPIHSAYILTITPFTHHRTISTRTCHPTKPPPPVITTKCVKVYPSFQPRPQWYSRRNCRTKLTNKPPPSPVWLRVTLFVLWTFLLPPCVAAQKNNFRRLLRTVEALSDLVPAFTAERDFLQDAHALLSAILQA